MIHLDDNGHLKKVMVWIHGGAFIFGGAYFYDAEYIMEEDVVLVRFFLIFIIKLLSIKIF